MRRPQQKFLRRKRAAKKKRSKTFYFMKHRRNGEPRRRLKYVADAPDLKSVGPALHLWLGHFEQYTREQDETEIDNLFHEKATRFWTEKDLPEFRIDVEGANIINCERTFVICAPWTCKSRILMGKDRSGTATFVLRLFETRILCVHVHIS